MPVSSFFLRFCENCKEKTEAKKVYDKAKKEGKRASLTEQNRPNIFTNNVANIMKTRYSHFYA